MSSREFSEWMAFDVLEPLGNARGDLQAAIVAATMANIWRGKDQPRAAIADFMPRFDAEDDGEADAEGEHEAQSARVVQQMAAIELWNAALGGRDLRKQA